MALKTSGFRKQVALYLLAVILPCAVLAAVTVRMIRQEQELARRTAAEECTRLAGEIGNAIMSRLEALKFGEMTALGSEGAMIASRSYIKPETVLITQVREGRLVLPWERDPRIEEATEALARSPFAARIRRGEEEEFIRKNFTNAVSHYRRGMDEGSDPIQRGYAALLYARALKKDGREDDALSLYRKVMDLPLGLVDELGIPLMLYATKPLLEDPSGPEGIIVRIGELLEGEFWLSPFALDFVQAATQELMSLQLNDTLSCRAGDLEEEVREYKRLLGAAAGLQERFPGLGLMRDPDRALEPTSPRWIYLSSLGWLAGIVSGLQDDVSLCVLIDGQTVLEAVSREFGQDGGSVVEFEWTSSFANDVEPLSPGIRNLGIRFSPEFVSSLIVQRSPQRSLYALLVILVLGLTLFGGYLLWRDVRRELRMAEMRSQFVSSVSHELKTPLTAIRMFAETMRLGRSKDPQAQEEYLDTIVNESQRLTRLLNNVLDFSKIEQGERRYHMQPAPLSEVVQAAARTMAYPLSQQGFLLHVQVEPDLPEVRMDRDAVEQALLNLLSNAMKYSGDSRDIDLRLSSAGNSALIQVVDRGPGIPPEEHGRIFEKYYRIRSGENERSAGTGLGLALVSHIVTAHGGQVSVESTHGVGSTFSLELPFEEST